MSPRAVLALIVVLVGAVLVGCGGGSSNQTVGSGGQTFTVPSDSHDVYGELEAILDQLPYQSWYTKCVVGQVRKVLGPAEAEALAKLPEAEREEKAIEITSKAGPICSSRHHLPMIDPDASPKELDLLRAGYVTSMTAVAEDHGATSSQITCIENGFKRLPRQKLIAIGNGSKTVREGILLSVFKPCAEVK